VILVLQKVPLVIQVLQVLTGPTGPNPWILDEYSIVKPTGTTGFTGIGYTENVGIFGDLIVDISGNLTTNTIQNTAGNVEIITQSSTGSLDLNSTIVNFKNTSTTTTTSTHNAEIKTTSINVSTHTFLKCQLNGVDIWIPYFTSDSSV